MKPARVKSVRLVAAATVIGGNCHTRQGTLICNGFYSRPDFDRGGCFC